MRLIDADALKTELEKLRDGWNYYGGEYESAMYQAYDISVDTVDEQPTVQPQRKKGRWINKFGKEQGYDIAGIKTWYIQILCDKCGFIKTAIEGHTGQYHYCPNCGAEMEVKE